MKAPKVTTAPAGTKHRYLDDQVDEITGEPGYLGPWREWHAAGDDPATEPAHVVVDLVAVKVDGAVVATVTADQVDGYVEQLAEWHQFCAEHPAVAQGHADRVAVLAATETAASVRAAKIAAFIAELDSETA